MPRRFGHGGLHHLSTIPLKDSHLFKIVKSEFFFYFQPSKLEKQCPFFKLTAIFLLKVSKLRKLQPDPTNYPRFLKTRRALPNPYAIYKNSEKLEPQSKSLNLINSV